MRAEILAVALTLAACTHVGPAGEDVGQFTFAGMTLGASAERRTVRWGYRFQFAIDPQTVTVVRLSCGQIQGTSVVVSAPDIGGDENRVAIWYGPESMLSNESLPWLYSGGTTSAICQGIFSRDGLPDSVARIPVSFSTAEKKRLVLDLQNAHDLRKQGETVSPP